MQFDLISDLHVDSWARNQQIEWSSVQKSRVCLVAGDVASEPARVREELKALSRCYDQVMYVDGLLEHRNRLHQLAASYKQLREALEGLSGVAYLKESSPVVGGVAVVGANGWWDYRFGEPRVRASASREAFGIAEGLSPAGLKAIADQAQRDYRHMVIEVDKLQNDSSVHSILMVTHAIPDPTLLPWDESPRVAAFAGTYGNTRLPNLLNIDVYQKIRMWVFGRTHAERKDNFAAVDFVSNPRGCPCDFGRTEYQPKQLVLNDPYAMAQDSRQHSQKITNENKMNLNVTTPKMGGKMGGM